MRIDVEVLGGDGVVAQVARHALAWEHAAGILRHAGSSRHVVRTAVAVRGALRAEVVALDRAGEALADRRAAARSTIWPAANSLDGHRGLRLVTRRQLQR